VFTARHTTVNSELAALYGVDAPGATDASTWVDVELPVDGPRAGLMTTAGILSIASHVDRSSPTRRGQFVRERLLCEFVPPPPMNFSLDIEQGAVRPDATVREKLEVHRTNPACAGCHAAIDPIGLGLEDFDAIGAFRTTEITASGDRPVDASGALDGEDFLGGRALGELLATDPRTSSCFVKQLYRNASARLEEPGEDAVIRDLVDRFEASGSRLSTLLVDLVASDGFRYLRAQEGANTQSGGNAP
ncbi:MAG: DUF1588 domain-containing protein, partial [Myxococcales bacterium]|nr:DUF1588 domain-containing protein [Myxococcales bacterium]